MSDAAIATMKELQALGVQLSIDDFGTGYSSLAALKSFPVTRLKIDKSFIADLVTNENDRAVTTAVISLGQKLNLRVIAEGVETEDQLAFLRENNCDEMQGYHFSRPVSADEIENVVWGGAVARWPSVVGAHREVKPRCERRRIPFAGHGAHQVGVLTPPQRGVFFCAQACSKLSADVFPLRGLVTTSNLIF